MIYNDAIWESVNDKVHKSLQLCAAAGCETDVKKMTDLHQKSTRQIINVYTSKLYHQFPPSHEVKDKMNVSTLLQLISMEYINILHKLLSYPSQGERLTISELVQQKVDHAASVGTNALFPT